MPLTQDFHQKNKYANQFHDFVFASAQLKMISTARP